MKAKPHEFMHELKRLESLLQKAHDEDLLFINLDATDHDDPSPVRPYSIFFNYDEMMDNLYNGSWYMVPWILKDRKTVKEALMKRINELQNLLIKI
jgi:hypothetical protein